MFVQRHCIGEDSADALAHPPGRLGLVVPDGVQHLEHVAARDVVDGQLQQRLGVTVQRVERFAGVALVAPPRRIEGMNRCSRLGERRHAGDLAAQVWRCPAVYELCTGPQLRCAPAGLVETDCRIGAEPDVAALAVGGDPGDP